MPRKKHAARLPDTVDPDGDVWGAEPDGDPDPAGLPPLPITAAVGDPPSEPPESLRALGAPPDSARDAQTWGFRVLMLQAHEAAMDPTISSSTRRKEVRVILAAAAKLYPDAARAEVASTIDEDRRQLLARQRAKAHAKLEARPPAGGAKVIAIRRG